MGASPDAAAFLTSWVLRDKKVITYRLLSRELRIHVDDAKAALNTFFDSNGEKEALDATYILIGRSRRAAAAEEAADKDAVAEPEASSSTRASSSSYSPRNYLDQRATGRLRPKDAPNQLVRLVPADKLDEAKASFDELTSCHIYSVSSGRLRDVTQLTAVTHDLHSQQKYVDVWQQTNRGADLGVVIDRSIRDNYDPSKTIPSLGAPSAPAIQVKKEAESAAASAIKSENAAQDLKPAAAGAAKSTTSSTASGGKKGGGLDWSRAKPKEAESKPAAAKKEAAANTRTAAKRGSAREALLGSDDEDEEDQDSSRSRKAIAIDDDDDEEDEKPEKLGYADDQADDEGEDDDVVMAEAAKAAPRGSGKRADARSQSKTQEAAQRKQLEAMMDTDDDEVQVVDSSGAAATKQAKDADPDVDMAASTVTETMNGSGHAPAGPKRRVRKKRKIGTKKVRSKDERGYTVTKTVDEYESYSSEESDAPVITGSKRGGGGSAKVQSKPAAESRSTSTSASASPAPTAPAASSNKSTPAPTNASARKSSGATPTPAKKGQQSLNSFFTRRPKDK